MTDHDEAALRRKATRRADAKLAFRYHLIIYLLVNAGLAVINVATGPQPLWFLWPALGWGVGLAIHGRAGKGMRSRSPSFQVRSNGSSRESFPAPVITVLRAPTASGE